MKRIFFIGSLLLWIQVTAQESFEDSLLQALSTANDSFQINIYNDLCWHFIYSETRKSISYGEKAAQIAERLDFDRGRAASYNRLGVGYDVLDIKDSALYYYRIALEAGERMGNERAVASTRNNIGLVYWHLGRYEDALKEYITSLKIFESLDYSVGIGNNLNNIGLIKYDLQEYDQAEEYHRRALEIRRSIDNKYGIAASLSNLGSVLWKQGKVDSSILLNLKSIDLKKELNDQYGLMSAYKTLGLNFEEIDQKDISLAYSDSALRIAKNLDVKREMASLYLNMSAKYQTQRNYDLATSYLDSSMAISKQPGYPRLLMLAHESRAALNEKIGKYRESLFHTRKQKAIRDSLFGLEKQEQLDEIEIRYETEKKEALNESLQKENKIAQLENERSQSLLYTSLGLFLLFSLGGGLFYSRRVSQRKSEHQQLLIAEKEKGMKAMVDATEMERKRISGDLHEGIGQQVSALKFSWEELEKSGDLDEPSRSRLSKLIAYLGDAGNELRAISHQMMPRSLERLGLVAAVSDMLDKSLGNSEIEFYFEHYYISGRFKEEVELSAYRIVQELINNIIRHSQANEVFVQLFKNKDNLLIIVEDNGIGIDPEQSMDGIGITNIQARLNTINGEFYIAPGPKKGTVAIARIPL